MSYENLTQAMINRSLRTVRAELEFLADAKVLTPSQLSNILSQLPEANAAAPNSAIPDAPVAPLQNLSIQSNNPAPAPAAEHEKAGYYTPQPTPQPVNHNPPPPAYPVPPAAPVVLTYATALYTYNAQDAGDLALMPNDRIAVTEYMNNEWWKGRSERSGMEGIFPRSYVRVEENKGPAYPGTNYGNVPLEVAQGGGSNGEQQPQKDSKGAEMGKKFGKKLGNAAIFGAGATAGSNLVNSIF